MSGASGGGPDGLVEPLPRPLAAALRRAVLAQATTEHRRSFPAILHVGGPGRREEAFALVPGDADDHALRTDVVAALLHRTGPEGPGAAPPLVWVTRPGPLGVEDDDAAWLSAARSAAAEAGLPLVFVVVTRHGWLDPRSGATRRWRRLRAR